MALMKEAMTKADFDRQEQGLPPIKPVRVERPDPEPPEVKDNLFASDVPPDYGVKLLSADRHNVRNDDGVLFTGYDVSIDLIPEKGEPQNLRGWMIEGQFLEFVRTRRKQIDQQVIRW